MQGDVLGNNKESVTFSALISVKRIAARVNVYPSNRSAST